MGKITRPSGEYTNDTQTADASLFNNDFDTLYNWANGNVDTDNMPTGGLKDSTKFANEVVKQANAQGMPYTQDLFGGAFVLSGGVATKDGTVASQLDVTAMVAYIGGQSDSSYRRFSLASKTFTTSQASATYYLDLQPDGTYNWGLTHSTQTGYLPIAQVATDGSGNISTVTDKRTTIVQLLAGATGPINISTTLQTTGSGVINANQLGGLLSTDVLQSRVSPNLVSNAGFETVTGTVSVFNDLMTSYTGTTVPAPWTNQAGTWSFGTGGATAQTVPAIMTAGNPAWKPLTGSNGSALAQTVQATFTTPSSGTAVFALYLWQDINNRYYIYVNGGYLYLYKRVAGTYASLTSVAFTPAVSTTYTLTLSITPSGLLTGKIYNGSGTGGSQPVTLPTATDTNLSGGFLVGVESDTVGVVITGVNANAPFADGWTIGGDSRVAWALTSSGAINGGHSVSAVGVAAGTLGEIQQNITVTSGTAYTFSGYLSTTNVGSTGTWYEITAGTPDIATTKISGTTSTTRYNAQITPTTTIANFYSRIDDVGTVTFDAIQLETGSSATAYIPQTQHPATPVDLDPASTVGLANIVRALSGGYKVQNGTTGSWSPTATGNQTILTVTFPVAYSTAPSSVKCGIQHMANGTAQVINVRAESISATQFTISGYVLAVGSSDSLTFWWESNAS